MADGRIYFLVGCWADGFSFLLSVCQRLLLIPCQWASLQNRSQHSSRERESTSKAVVTILWNVIMQVTLLCHTLLVRSKSHAIPRFKGRWLQKVWLPGGGNYWGPFESLSAILPDCFSKVLVRWHYHPPSVRFRVSPHSHKHLLCC